MPQPKRRKIAQQVGVQLIEADVETGFALVDEAKDYVASGQMEAAVKVLREAAKVVVDIEQRLQRIGGSESAPFQPLITELRDELAAVDPTNQA